MNGNDHVAGRHGIREREAHADEERPLEYGQRLILAHLLEVRSRWKDDFSEGKTVWWLDAHLGRNQRGIAGLVRLNMEALGKTHLERNAGAGSSVDSLALDQRNDICLRPRQLSIDHGGCHE